MYRQIVKQLAFQLLTAFHVNVWDWHFLHIPTQPSPPYPPTPTRTHRHTHTPSPTSVYFLCQQKNKREGKAREGPGGERVRREWRRSRGRKTEKQKKSRLLPGLAKGQSWQARRLNCRVKILFIILGSLFPNSPLLCHSQCPASMFPHPRIY